MDIMLASELADLFTRMAKQNPDKVYGIDYIAESVVSATYPDLPADDIRDCLRRGEGLYEVDILADRMVKTRRKYNG